MLISLTTSAAWCLLRSPLIVRETLSKIMAVLIWRKKKEHLCKRVGASLLDLSAVESEAVAKKSLAFYVSNVFSVLDIEREKFVFHGLDLLTRCQSEGGVLATLHVGKVDAAAYALKIRGFSVKTMINPRSGKPHLYRLGTQILDRLGLPFLTGGQGSLFKMVDAIKNGEWMFIHSDLRGKGEVCDFLGHQAEVVSTAPALAVLSGRPLYLCYGIFVQGQHHIHCELVGNSEILPDQGIKKDIVIKLLTQQLATRMTEVIQRFPEQWLWVYRRFK